MDKNKLKSWLHNYIGKYCKIIIFAIFIIIWCGAVIANIGILIVMCGIVFTICFMISIFG